MRKIYLVSILLIFSAYANAQIKGDVFLLDSTPQYNTAPACSFAEFGEYMSCIDSNNRITVLSIENYELFMFESTDSGQTWYKNQLMTLNEGDLYCTFITTTPGGKRVIIYGINSYYNYGSTLSTSNYFRHSSYALVEVSQGNWVKTTLSPPASTNNGLLPFGIFVDNAGNIRAYLHQRGWYTYGGYIHEMIYNTSTDTWGSINQIYGYSQTIDRGTAWYAGVGQEPNGDIFLIYRKQTNNASINEFVLLKQVSGSWSSVTPQILDSDFPTTYWGWDISTDDMGNFYFVHTEANGPNGPRVTLAKNSYIGTELYPFTTADTLSAVTFIDVDGREPVLLCVFRDPNVGIKFYEYDGTNLNQIDGPKFDTPADSVDFYDYPWVPWSMASSANFGTLPFTISFRKESQGRDPNTNAVLEMPFRLIRTWPKVYDTLASIYYFSLPGMISSTVDTINQTIDIIMPVGTDVTNIAPDSILTNPTAHHVYPGVGDAKDFTSPVQYNVFAEEGLSSFIYWAEVTFNVSLEEQKTPQIKIYPNPSRDIVNVELSQLANGEKAKLEVLNILGNKVMEETINTSKHSIDLGEFNQGIYFVKVSFGDTKFLRKMIKL